MPASGTLQVRVYTSNAQLPLPGATVLVSSSGDSPVLLSVQITNSSGKTQPITVETPVASESTSPGIPYPFTSLNITVDAPLFRQEVLRNVQIFPGILSVQNVEMIPLDENAPNWDLEDIVNFPNQNL